MIVLHVFLWGGVAAAIVVALLLRRRVRALFAVVAPMGALAPADPSSLALASVHYPALDGTILPIGGMAADGRSTLLLAVDPDCPVSIKMAPLARHMATAENLRLVLLGDAEDTILRAGLARLQAHPSTLINDARLGRVLGVDRLPFAVLIGPSGQVVARGLVNSREHLESLTGVARTGHATIQSWLAARQAGGLTSSG